jgi:hypothetical protein
VTSPGRVPPSTPNFTFVDKRGRTASGLQVNNLQAEMNNLRQRLAGVGYQLPKSDVQARTEANNVATMLENRRMSATITKERLANARLSGNDGGGRGSVRTASNMMQVIPKMRTPMGTLADKGIPFNFENPKELIEIRRWSRLYYACHNLVPLLIDTYAKFPLIGLEFESKDPEIKDFYTTQFMDTLNYGSWLSNALAREYFISGEVTALAHFSEQLGTWESEEILNPDMLDVSRSILVDRDRVQLRVKEMVDNLRTGPGGVIDSNETDSQRQERVWQYKMLQRHYPEIIHAAAKDDGLDLSEALISRIVNKVSSWDVRGTPMLLRAFDTLIGEEGLKAAQNAISDRLYSPFILAKLGVPNLGDGEPWIPDQADLDNVRNDINNALMADLRVIVGNFSLEIESVFGREAMPRFGEDFDRADRKILQCFGIGEDMVSGGSAGTYASSAINRDFVTQQMVDFQNLAKAHILKRAEVIAEAQEHYDYEKKGAYRRPLYRDIVEIDPRTGEEHIVKVPKLLLPDVIFKTLNLRDEAQERAFMQQLKGIGVPISDQTLAINIDFDPQQELEKSSEETYQKLIAQTQVMDKVQAYCDRERKPYPPELVQQLSATLQLRQALGQTEMLEDQAKALKQQTAQASPAGQMGILPGTVGQPTPPAEGQKPGGPPISHDPNVAAQQQMRDQQSSQHAASLGQQIIAADGKIQTPGTPVAAPPSASPPTAKPPVLPGVPITPEKVREVPRNRVRPPESDEARGTMPKAGGNSRQRRKSRRTNGGTGDEIRPISKLERGPSSWKASWVRNDDDLDRIESAVRRRQRIAEHRPESGLETLLANPLFWDATEKHAYREQIEADLPDILAAHGDTLKMNRNVRHSARLLEEALDQYEFIFGCVVDRPDSY